MHSVFYHLCRKSSRHVKKKKEAILQQSFSEFFFSSATLRHFRHWSTFSGFHLFFRIGHIPCIHRDIQALHRVVVPLQ